MARFKLFFGNRVQAGGVSLSPPAANLALSSTTPGVVVTGGVVISPAAAQLALSGVAPSRVTDERRDPAQANLALSAAAPSVVQSDNLNISPAARDLTLSTVVPTVARTDHVSLAPAAAQLALSSVAPTVALGAHVSVSPAARDLALSSEAPAVAVHQYMRPDADVSDGGWTDQDGGTSLFAAVDEDPRDGADYIKSSGNPVADICRLRIGNPGGLPAQPFQVQYEYHKTGTAQIDLLVRLYQGAIEIAEWSHSNIADADVFATQELSAGEFAAITDFNDLEIEFEANAP